MKLRKPPVWRWFAEQGFMRASVFVEDKDSEALTIDNQVKGEEFDFSGNTWDE